MRISGVTIPKDKQVRTSLTYIYGIGETRSGKILDATQIDPMKRTQDLTPDEEDRLREYITKNFQIEGDLRSQNYNAIKRMKDVNCYKGIRHKKRLPARGQRTKTNARTLKGKKVNRIGGKKSK